MSCFVALLAVQAALRRRDSEIGRLGAQVERGRDVDGLVMHHRNETNESIILQLNQQVGVLEMVRASYIGLRLWKGAREPACRSTPAPYWLPLLGLPQLAAK